MFKSVGASGPSPGPLFGSGSVGDGRRVGEGRKKRKRRTERGKGRTFPQLLPLCQPLDAFHSTSAPEKPPVWPSPGGWTEKEQPPPPGSPPGGERRRKERRLVGGSKGGRQAGGRRREGGEREGRRRDVRTKNRGAGAGKGCREGAARQGGLEAPGGGAGG